MNYYYSKILENKNFQQAIELVTRELKNEGFGIVSQIDVKNTFKEKLNIDYRQYLILGACNPKLAHQVLKIDDKIGVFLPCNIILQEKEGGNIEVAFIDSITLMSQMKNDDLRNFAIEADKKLKKVFENLK